MERREQGPGIHFEDSARHLLDAARDAEPVHRLQAERLENQHVQRALDYVRIRLVHMLLKDNSLPYDCQDMIARMKQLRVPGIS